MEAPEPETSSQARLPRQVLYNMVADARRGKYEHFGLIWKKDQNCNTEVIAWKDIVTNTGWSIRDVRKCTHNKIIHRYYFTPVRFHKMGSIQNNIT